MVTPGELDKIAELGNALRPDWPVDGLRSHLAANHGTRPYRDLAVALAWIAADPTTTDPTRLAEDGPWWEATNPRPQALTTKSGQRQFCPEHHIPLTAGVCERCEARTAVFVPGRAAQLWRDVKHTPQED